MISIQKGHSYKYYTYTRTGCNQNTHHTGCNQNTQHARTHAALKALSTQAALKTHSAHRVYSNHTACRLHSKHSAHKDWCTQITQHTGCTQTTQHAGCTPTESVLSLSSRTTSTNDFSELWRMDLPPKKRRSSQAYHKEENYLHLYGTSTSRNLETNCRLNSCHLDMQTMWLFGLRWNSIG